MNKPLSPHSCCNCQNPVEAQVYKYSLEHYDYALCISCQGKLRDKMKMTTPHALALYFLLRKKGIAAELEKSDGHKTIDIAVVKARLNIEVDGSHHNTKHDQALADLQRTYYAFEKGYFTLRIPNSLLKNRLIETANYVANFVELSLRKVRS